MLWVVFFGFVIEGSILAMVAVVTVVAGVATVTTQKLHSLFSGGDPKDASLKSKLQEWRRAIEEKRASLIKLKRAELDLLAQEPKVDKSLLKAKNRTAGTLQSIYQEPIAYFVHEDFPKAKIPHALTIVVTHNSEIVYRLRGSDTFVTLGGEAIGVIQDGKFIPPGKDVPFAQLELQPDDQTVHVDREDHTIAILTRAGRNQQIVPRAFEFVDVNTDQERMLLEVLSFHFLLTNNLSPS